MIMAELGVKGERKIRKMLKSRSQQIIFQAPPKCQTDCHARCRAGGGVLLLNSDTVLCIPVGQTQGQGSDYKIQNR